jgi:hypothetical protein
MIYFVIAGDEQCSNRTFFVSQSVSRYGFFASVLLNGLGNVTCHHRVFTIEKNFGEG